MSHIIRMEEKKNILDHLKKTSRPDVPKDFFENFSSNIMDKIEEDSESGLLDDLKKTGQPEIPKDFFSKFPDEVLNKVQQDNEGKSNIFKISAWTTVISIAAVLAIMFWINREDTNESFAEESDIELPESKMSDDDYDAYLVYVDEGEIIDYMVENELDYEETTEEDEYDYDEIYDYVGDDLEELYLEL